MEPDGCAVLLFMIFLFFLAFKSDPGAILGPIFRFILYLLLGGMAIGWVIGFFENRRK